MVTCRTPSVLAITESLMSKSCDNNFNYERLEIIGDAFLKFEASLHCFRAFPTSHEGERLRATLDFLEIS